MTSQAFIHFFLIDGINFTEAKEKVANFLDKYQLVNYDKYHIDTKESFIATDKIFWTYLENALAKNKSILKDYLNQLSQEGAISSIFDVENIPQGYLSKLFHLIAHLVDGFFGIDSYFYNLIEDSHFISPVLMKKLKEDPSKYFLIKVLAQFYEPTYYFELLSPKKFFKK